jgi:heme-degrading monooxygenase HmoA
VIARLWRGWAEPAQADAYERLLRTTVLPAIDRIGGYRGAYLMRREDGAEVAFVTLTLWDSLAAVRAFAGEDYEHAVVPPAARELLSRFDETALHYETLVEPTQA